MHGEIKKLELDPTKKYILTLKCPIDEFCEIEPYLTDKLSDMGIHNIEIMPDEILGRIYEQ